MNIDKIDNINYARRTVPSMFGDLAIEGMTVRAMRKALEACDPDDLIVYIAEATPEMKKVDVIIGCIAGVATQASNGVSFMFGPEGIKGLKDAGVIE